MVRINAIILKQEAVPFFVVFNSPVEPQYLINIENLINYSSCLLKDGGNFSLIHRTDRFIEIISLLKKYNLEPKRIIFIYNKLSKGSQLFFIESQKNADSGLKIDKPFIVYNEDNTYTDEYNRIIEGVL